MKEDEVLETLILMVFASIIQDNCKGWYQMQGIDTKTRHCAGIHCGICTYIYIYMLQSIKGCMQVSQYSFFILFKLSTVLSPYAEDPQSVNDTKALTKAVAAPLAALPYSVPQLAFLVLLALPC